MVGEENGIDEAEAREPEPRTSPSLETECEDAESPVRSQEMDTKVLLANGSSHTPEILPSTPDTENNAQAEEPSEEQTDPPIPQDDQPPRQISASKGSRFEVETKARLDALAHERTALQLEVAQLRRSLEEVQERHDEELTGLREQLTATQDEKEHAETQYHTLLGKVNTIKSQLGERLKADAVRLRL